MQMDLDIYITTLGRINNQKTWDNLRVSPSIVQCVTTVVQAHELEAFKKARPAQRVMALPAHIDNLGATRQWLIDRGRAENRKIVLLDDDLDFYVRRDPSDWRLTTPLQEMLESMFDEISHALDTHVHVGVSGREGNNRVMDYAVENTRFMRLLAYRPAAWPEGIRADRVDGMSDFDTNLQLLRKGYASKVFYRYAQGQPGTQTPGGCALTRTLATHEAEVNKMCEMHPEFVRKRMKTNKGGGEFGTRPELTIYWKKAFDSRP